MAYAQTQTGIRSGGFFARLSADLRDRLAKRRIYNQTFRELSMLSGRELADLGLHRSQLRAIAWQAANER